MRTGVWFVGQVPCLAGVVWEPREEGQPWHTLCSGVQIGEIKFLMAMVMRSVVVPAVLPVAVLATWHSAARTSQATPLWLLAIPFRAYRLLLWGLCVIVAAGCGGTTKVIGLWSDPSFTYQSLSTGRIAVGGVTSLVGQNDPATQHQRTSLLRERILKERPDIGVRPVEVIIHALGGRDAYMYLVADYRLSGEIAETWLEQLSRAADVQYAIFARIERYETEKEKVTERDTSDVEVTTFRISRSVGISFHIYDLTTGVSVWSGYIDKTEEKSRVHRERGSILTSVVESLLGLNPSGYPSPPKFSKLSSEVFEGFADNLPEQ